MSNKELGKDHEIKEREKLQSLDEDKYNAEEDIDRINAHRESDFEEDNDFFISDKSEETSDLADDLQGKAENIEESFEWLEIGASIAGGGVPVMGGGGLEDAIRDAIESEFKPEEMMEDAVDKLKDSEVKGNSLSEGIYESSGFEPKPKGVKK